MDLQQSNNIINSNSNDYNNNSFDEIDNNLQIVKTKNGEIFQKNLKKDELYNFKASKEYHDMIVLYKQKLYPDFIKSNEKNNSEEAEQEYDNNNISGD